MPGVGSQTCCGCHAERRPQGGSWGSSRPRSSGPGLSLSPQVPDRWVPAAGPAALRPRGALPARPARLHRRPRVPGQLRPARQRRAPVRGLGGSGCCPRRAWVAQGAVPSGLLVFRSLGGASSAKPGAGSYLWRVRGLVWSAWISSVCCSGVLWALTALIPVPAPHQFLLQMCHFHLVVMSFVQPPEFPHPCLLDLSPSSGWGGRT